MLRVMAEELRHGYQMFHMLTSRNWEPLAGIKTEDMVEDVLAMKTGSHVLEAFNLPYDSFVDNVVFSGIITEARFLMNPWMMSVSPAIDRQKIVKKTKSRFSPMSWKSP